MRIRARKRFHKIGKSRQDRGCSILDLDGFRSTFQNPKCTMPYTGRMPVPAHTPMVLIIRDGWGENPHPEHDPFNAIKLARTPVADCLMCECPATLIVTCGEDVGLPPGTMGNSEVGHQNIG